MRISGKRVSDAQGTLPMLNKSPSPSMNQTMVTIKSIKNATKADNLFMMPPHLRSIHKT
jgi:hypothetical protein